MVHTHTERRASKERHAQGHTAGDHDRRSHRLLESGHFIRNHRRHAGDVAIGAERASRDDSGDAPLPPSAAATTAAPSNAAATTAAPAATGFAGDACALMTRDEASALAGVEMPEPKRLPFAAGTDCIYQLGTDYLMGVGLYSTPGTKAVLDQNAPLFAADMAPIDGIGDAAYFSVKEGTIGVLAKGVIFTIGGLVNRVPLDEATLRPAAERAISRL